ncbi:MAG: response regulator [Chloroflexi bacterium]|nr:response regulator [Chloroflexota bacterium]
MKTILIVEDDPLNAKLMEVALPKMGDFKAVVEEDVESILSIVKEDRAQLIVLDISLANSIYQDQNVDGVKIAGLIREMPEKGDIPIILLTAFAMEGDDEKLISQTGADYYFPKPLIDITVLADKIKELLGE